ncbi:Alpha/Beta hydrolase protein [Podospora didyma]|uniref:Alpha/Beta hydrolase protein n=1 Tax=Podospora didyma TaxID=330526 RepID=A0AAE0TVP5_9PEZI|nr:Alpha/Beta hydrolase protein [Podospora didyma]
MNMNTATVGLAVTPTVISTLFTHYLSRKRLSHVTTHISYDEGLHLIRSFLAYASRHTVEEVQAFTSQWVPHPQWVKVDEVDIPEDALSRAASHLQAQLGPEGIRKVGGKEWWQWRKPKTPLKAEWVEMRSNYHERTKNTDPGNRVMLYVHGGAYYFGSVDEHRYQIQRHARKLKARALAPRYRLAPQFPFPCGLQDCLATYLYLLTCQEPSTIILAGDSAGAGIVLSLLVTLRDRGISLPAGAVLISPWVDLTHSFPSVAGDCPLDYIPPSGFHHKPSRAWPPPDEEVLEELKRTAIPQKKDLVADEGHPDPGHGVPTVGDVADATTRLSLLIDGEKVEIKEQIQIYTTNDLISHPLVSPIMQPTLGGLPPLLIMVGGGETLRDEQIYLAHKCANPSRYAPADDLMDDHAKAQLNQFPPTDIQLQVWDDLCHVAPTLSFTTPAKYMYRSVAQFAAWALARAQNTGIDILDDDQISVISNSSESSDDEQESENKDDTKRNRSQKDSQQVKQNLIGKAGDPLPPFKDHMIRQAVTSHGIVYALPPPEDLPGCIMDRELVGVIKVGPVRKWLDHKKRWDARFRKTKVRVHKKHLKDMAAGYEIFGEGEVPPPSALAGRRKIGGSEFDKKKEKSIGLSLWALWGSKHDKMTVQREQDAGKADFKEATSSEGQGARTFSDIQKQEKAPRPSRFPLLYSRKGSRSRVVQDEHQVEEREVHEEHDKTPTAAVKNEGVSGAATASLSPDGIEGTGVTGKRMFIGGLATPFSLLKEPESASMITLMSPTDELSVRQGTPSSRSNRMEPATDDEKEDSASPVEHRDPDGLTEGSITLTFSTPLPTPGLLTPGDRPGMERFVTADEVPRSN